MRVEVAALRLLAPGPPHLTVPLAVRMLGEPRPAEAAPNLC